MKTDTADAILDQWSAERPELDTAELGIVIRIMSLNRYFAKQAAAALEPLDLELWEYDVLSALRRQGEPFALVASALARESELSTGAMTNRVDRLEERGLVRREVDPSDRRSVIIYLTPSGHLLIDEAISYRLEAAGENLQSLSAEDREQLATLLRNVILDTKTED